MTKFNAFQIEEQILRSPLIKRCVMGDDDHPNPFLILELQDKIEDQEHMREIIWHHVKSINAKIPSSIWIEKELLLFTKPDKPMQVGFKGTVNSRGTLEDYMEEIEALY
jgi:hypothetical protein